jgi:hypothetical protein
MNDVPFACQLTDAEFRARRAGLLSDVRTMARSAAWGPDELRLVFPSEASLGSVFELVAAERVCCPFLQFRLTTGPGEVPSQFTIIGPPGARRFLETLGLADPPR